MEETPLTRERIVEMLGLPGRASLTKHGGDRSYTYTAHYSNGGAFESKAAEVAADLMRRALASGYTLRVTNLARVLGQEGNYNQKFTFLLIKNDPDPAGHNLTLVVACYQGVGHRSARAAITIKDEPLYGLGLFQPGKNGAVLGVEAVADSIAYLKRPARITLVTDAATAAEIDAAQAGGGCVRTREFLAREPGLTFLPVTPEELRASGGGEVEAGLNGELLVQAYEVCFEVASDLVRRGQVTGMADERMNGLKKLFRAH